jgi:hypothetical protein
MEFVRPAHFEMAERADAVGIERLLADLPGRVQLRAVLADPEASALYACHEPSSQTAYFLIVDAWHACRLIAPGISVAAFARMEQEMTRVRRGPALSFEGVMNALTGLLIQARATRPVVTH